MHIRSVRCIEHILEIDAPGWSLITGRVAKAPCAVIAVEAADGTVGYGTIPALQPFELPLAAVTACVAYLRPLVEGQPLNIAALMRDLHRALMVATEVKSAFEVAFYDLAARLRGVSLGEYLGGSLHRKIPVIRLVPLQTPKEMAAFAGDLVNAGHRALKLKLSGEENLDVDRVSAVRERVGPGIRLTVDANCRYDVKAAIRSIERMDRFNVDIVEQPVPRTSREGLALITRTVRPMVEADESAMNVEEIAALVHERIVDCVNLRITRLGGIRPALAAARICEAGDVKYRFGLMLLPSHFSAATLHAASTVREVPVGHEIGEHELFRNDIFEPLPVVEGAIQVPEGPGVGIALKARA